MKRIPMVLQLKRLPQGNLRPCRAPRTSDGHDLAVLLYAAFRGTIDDEGESFADAQHEIEKTLSGDYGRLMMDCSFVIEHEDGLAAACLISWYEPSAAPLVVFTMTAPTLKGRGLARFLLVQSINALVERGHAQLELIVTDGNEPAQRLYASLGFQEMEPA